MRVRGGTRHLVRFRTSGSAGIIRASFRLPGGLRIFFRALGETRGSSRVLAYSYPMSYLLSPNTELLGPSALSRAGSAERRKLSRPER